MLSTIFTFLLPFIWVLLSAKVYVNSCGDSNDCSQTSSPQQLRVALHGTNIITISWKTDIAYNTSNNSTGPGVQYSTNSSLENGTIVYGNSSTYTKYGPVSWFHDVLLPVNSSTQYYYRVLASGCINSSANHSFLSPIAVGDPKPITITFVSNFAFSSTDKRDNYSNITIQALTNVSKSTSFFLHIGGFGNADSFEYAFYNISKTYEYIWNRFQDTMEEVTAKNILMTAPGSHEVTCFSMSDCVCTRNSDQAITSQYRNFSAYLHRFSMPGGDSDMTYKNMWYSFDYGMAHFVIINTETDFPDAPSGPNTSLNAGNFAPNGTQLTWLAADLKDARNRSCEVPWIIVAGYRHWYGTPYRKPSSSTQLCPSCGAAFAEILFDNKVDFYFSGNFDWYERLYPVNRNGTSSRKNYTEPEGPIYITVGSGGNLLDVFPQTGDYSHTTAKIVKKYGFTNLKIYNSTHAELNFHQSSNFQVMDNQTVIRSDPCKKTCSS